MHGDISQQQREYTLKRFKENRFPVLVATDVASRGIHIPDIELVVQLEPPKDTEAYIHRSGRTARAGKSGTCITLFNRKNREFLDRVEDLAGIRMEIIQIPNDGDMGPGPMGKKRGNFDSQSSHHRTAKDLLQQHGGDPEKALMAALSGNTHSNKENMGNNFGGGKPRDGGFKKDRGYNDGGFNKDRSYNDGGFNKGRSDFS
jgi:ATP-dependent RNA helicase DDX21